MSPKNKQPHGLHLSKCSVWGDGGQSALPATSSGHAFQHAFRFYFYCLPATLVRGHRTCLALAQHQDIQQSFGDPGPPHQPLHSLGPTVKDSVLLLPPSSADGSQQPARTASQSPLQDKSLLSALPHELAESEAFLCGQKEHARKRELLNASQSEAGEAAAVRQLLDPRK